MTLYWTFSVVSIALQALMVLYSLLVWGRIEDQKSWIFWILAALLVFIRRLILTVRAVPANVVVSEWEFGMTIVITMLWIAYVWQRSKHHRGET